MAKNQNQPPAKKEVEKTEVENLGEVIIFQDSTDEPKLEVRLVDETVWLSQAQLIDLYDSSKANVSEHIKNIFTEGELDRKGTVRKFRTVQTEGLREINREIEFYNLDMIISLGYRIKSKTATQFRRWATSILKEYTLRGVVSNQKRLEQLGQYLEIISRSSIPEVAGIGDLMKNYLDAFNLLEEYDNNSLSFPIGSKETWHLTYDEARSFLDELRATGDFNENFAKERGEQFAGIITGLYQTFNGAELYQSVEEKAANLLYQVVKDHPFVDGNKRSAAGLFIYFLTKNGLADEFNKSTLTATTLMTALSDTKENEQIILLIRNLLAKTGQT